MRIITRKQFIELPDNILYSKFEPCVFGELQIKGESIGEIDFYSQDIAGAVACESSFDFADILFKAIETGDSFDMDFSCESRDGMFEDGALYAVWEKSDIDQLITRLQQVRGFELLSPPPLKG